MHILIPLNLEYIRDRYRMSEFHIAFLLDYVVPEMLNRYCLDSRVETVELLSDFNLKGLESLSDKITATTHVIPSDLDANGVVAHLIDARKTESQIIVQCNPLFPFISINSLHRGYRLVAEGEVLSAVGSITDKLSVHEEVLATEHDLGIFSVYTENTFRSTARRVSPPFSEIGLQAVELIGLRNSNDIDLFNLIVNSGFSL